MQIIQHAEVYNVDKFQKVLEFVLAKSCEKDSILGQICLLKYQH